MTTEKKTQFSLEEWSKTMPKNFDVMAEYAKRVQPIIDQLLATCRELQMPALVLVSNKQDNEGSYIGGYNHFAGPSRVPAAMLMAMHASKLDLEAIVDVSHADEERGKAFVAAMGGIGGVMASVTKH